MANSVSRQNEPNLALCIPAVSCKKNFSESHFINPLIDQACSADMAGYSPRFLFTQKHAKKELGQYLAILTTHLKLQPS